MDGIAPKQKLPPGRKRPPITAQAWQTGPGFGDLRHMYYRSCSPVASPAPPPYPPPPYSPAPYPAMAYPPPYSAAQYALQPYPPPDKHGHRPYPAQSGAYDPRLEHGPQHQSLVCTCHPATISSPAVADDDGLMAPRCSCPPEPAPSADDRRRRSTSRGSNFSEDSLSGEVAPAAVPMADPPVVMRGATGAGGGARSPQKRRSLTQEYLAAQAETSGRRNSQLGQAEGELVVQDGVVRPAQGVDDSVGNVQERNSGRNSQMLQAEVELVGQAGVIGPAQCVDGSVVNGHERRGVADSQDSQNVDSAAAVTNVNLTGTANRSDGGMVPAVERSDAVLASEELDSRPPVKESGATDKPPAWEGGATEGLADRAVPVPSVNDARTRESAPDRQGDNLNNETPRRLPPADGAGSPQDREHPVPTGPAQTHGEPEPYRRGEPDMRQPSPPVDRSFGPATRRRSQVYEDRPSSHDIQRLSQVYNEPMVSLMPETRRLSQVCDEPAGRRVPQCYEDRPARHSQVYDDYPLCEPQRLSQAYTEHAAMGPPHHPHETRRAPPEQKRLSQTYDDRPAAADTRRMSQSYDDYDSRRISQPYDDRPVSADPRRLDDRPSTADPRRSSQAYEDRPATAESRRLSLSYDDRAAAAEPGRPSQAYDDRLAPADSRRMSQPYDDYDSRRQSQIYDDRPVESRRLSQVYDDRPASSESRRLSQAYDDRPAASEVWRLPQSYDDRPARPVSRSFSHNQLHTESSQGGAATGDGSSSDPKPACQKYDERPCTAAAADGVPAAVAVKPWWEKPPDRRTPGKPKPKEPPSRRSSVDRTPRPSPSAASPDRTAAGDADDSPVAFTVDLGPPAAVGGRRLHVKDSISRWAPRYRRSLSSAHKDDETRSDSGELPSAGTSVPRPRSLLNRRKPGQGYHSEGYFSSDQDADNRDKRALARVAGERPPSGARSPSPRRCIAAAGCSGARLSAARRATVTRATGSGLKKSATLGTMPGPQPPPPPQQHKSPSAEDGAADDVSEAGTYTIENEPEDNAVQQVNAAFSGLDAYDEESGDRRRNSAGDSSSHEPSPDRDTDTPGKPSAYGSGSNWIEQWAAEVTKHNQQNIKRTAQHATVGSAEKPPPGSVSPWSRHTVSPDGVGSRPRRKLPTPPAARHSPSASGDRERPAALSTSLDTESYLRTTEDVVSALQARLDASTATGEDSDSVSSDSSDRPPAPVARPPPAKPATPAGIDFKFNRALSLRRARLGLDDGPPPAPSSNKSRPSASPTARPGVASGTCSSSGGRKLSDSESGKKTGSFARSDGGRFSLRMANGTPKAPTSRTPSAVKKPTAGGGGRAGGGPRSAAAAAQATRDQEMANWKRRKNYDPLKAAKEARRKQVEPGVGGSQSDSACGTVAPLRSASFHGTDGLGAALLRRRRGLHSEDETSSPTTAPTASGVHRRSPPAPAADDSDPSDVFHDEVSAACSTRKVSLDASRRSSPLYRGQASSSLRNKVKLEALDNLVISTIHTLSSKIRGDSESLVSKLKCQFDEEDVRHTLLDDVMTTLTTDTPSASKASSRDLAGILKNLRKVEQAVQVLEQVLCDDDDVSDGEDVDAGDKFGDGFY